MAGINIREISADTLVEILEHGEFSHIYLKAVLDKYSYLEKNERAFITRLVNGTVERMLQLDHIINSYSKTKVKKMKPLIRTIIRMGAFEIYYMDSVP
ncbi:MAG: 16S rRNA (cytosine(967)-C(5))-methyltransferase, partial [Pseudobutyrivibrio sp.]|nr:16S rRNA (cytosine(967)-C(5))-methyltransferase [Pseudobutyrivibrio sp.]